MKHLSNGCSFSTKKLIDQTKQRFGSCHQHLGSLLNLEPTINLAKGGRGNDRIVNSTMNWFYANPERMKDTFVSIGWSSTNRWDFVSNYVTPKEKDGGIKGELLKFSYQWDTWSVWQNEFLLKDPNIDHDLNGTVRLYTHVLALQNFFKLHGIKYIMYHALTNDTPTNEVNGKQRPDLKLFYDQIDQTHFFNFQSSEFAKENIITQQNNRSSKDHVAEVKNTDYVQSHFEYVAKNKLRKTRDDAHPNPEGHKQWAELLHKFVVKNKLV
jgi:hypothetical protein